MFYRVCGVPNNMVLIPAGTFRMGDTLDNDGNAIPTNVYVGCKGVRR
jgi:hypothetical protein